MAIYSREILLAALQRLVKAGVIHDHSPFGDWYNAAGEVLTQGEVDALCVDLLIKEEVADEPPVSTTVVKQGKGKGGRPKVPDEEKLKGISVMVSPARYQELHDKAGELGMSVSQLVRPMVDPQKASNKQRLARQHGRGLSVEERALLRQVAGMSGNLNQLVKLAHTVGLAALAGDLRKLMEALRPLLKY